MIFALQLLSVNSSVHNELHMKKHESPTKLSNIFAQIYLDFEKANKVKHKVLRVDSTSTFRCIHMEWLFWILETCLTRFEHHWIQKSSLKFTPYIGTLERAANFDFRVWIPQFLYHFLASHKNRRSIVYYSWKLWKCPPLLICRWKLSHVLRIRIA